MAYSHQVHHYFADYFKNPVLRPFLYLLSKRLSEGHICLDLENIDYEEIKESGFKNNLNITSLKEQTLVSCGKEKQPFILSHNKLYLQRYFHYESVVISAVQNLIAEGKKHEAERKRLLLEKKQQLLELFPENDEERIDWQKIAALLAILHQFTIITGGPGTGKTTTVAKLLTLNYLLQSDLKVALAAPTGKAATRMAASLSTARVNHEAKSRLQELEPTTIHRLLGWKKDSLYFKHHQDNPLPYDLIVIDESSMIDMALFAKLLRAIDPTQTRVILLGDKNQLASVEAGSLFGDLCLAPGSLNLFTRQQVGFLNRFISKEYKKIGPDHLLETTHLLAEHIVELRHSHRFDRKGGIGKLGQSLIQNNLKEWTTFFDNKDEAVFVDTTYDASLFNRVIRTFEEYIQEADPIKALQKFDNLRVLCAVREGEQGLYELNRKIEQQLARWGLIRKEDAFYEHRPVMVTGNNYELGLFNGDIGITRKDVDGNLKVCFMDREGKPKWMLPALLDATETVFAMTIHKSQGSEFKKVMVVLPEKEDLPLLTRELLYTAVTRAREKVVLQGKKNCILSAAEKLVERGSGIISRL